MAGFSSRLREKFESTRSNAATGHVQSNNQPKNIRGLTRLSTSSGAAAAGGLLSGSRANGAGGASVPLPVQTPSLRKENGGQDGSVSLINRPPPQRAAPVSGGGRGAGASSSAAVGLGGSKIVPGWGAGASADESSSVPSGHLGGIKPRDDPTPRELERRSLGGEQAPPPSGGGKNVPWALHQPSSSAHAANFSQRPTSGRRWGDEEDEDDDEEFPQIGNKKPSPAVSAVTSDGEKSRYDRYQGGDRVAGGGDRGVGGGRYDTGVDWHGASNNSSNWRGENSNGYSNSPPKDRLWRRQAGGNYDDGRGDNRDWGDYGSRRQQGSYRNDGGYNPRERESSHLYDRGGYTRTGYSERGGSYGDDRKGSYGDDRRGSYEDSRWGGESRRGLYDRRSYNDDTNDSRWRSMESERSHFGSRRESGGNAPYSRGEHFDGGRENGSNVYHSRRSEDVDRGHDRYGHGSLLASQSRAPDDAKQTEVDRNGIGTSAGVSGSPRTKITSNSDYSSTKRVSEARVSRASAPNHDGRSMFQQNRISDDSTPMLLLRSNEAANTVSSASSQIDKSEKHERSQPTPAWSTASVSPVPEVKGKESPSVSAEAPIIAGSPEAARPASATQLDKLERLDSSQPPPAWSAKSVTSVPQVSTLEKLEKHDPSQPPLAWSTKSVNLRPEVSTPRPLISAEGTKSQVSDSHMVASKPLPSQNLGSKKAPDSIASAAKPSSNRNLQGVPESVPLVPPAQKLETEQERKNRAMEQQQNILRQVAERRAAEASRKSKSLPEKKNEVKWERGKKLPAQNQDKMDHGRKDGAVDEQHNVSRQEAEPKPPAVPLKSESLPEKKKEIKWERGKKMSNDGEDEEKAEPVKEHKIKLKEKATPESGEKNAESENIGGEEEHTRDLTECPQSEPTCPKVGETKVKTKGRKETKAKPKGDRLNPCPKNPKSESFAKKEVKAKPKGERPNPCRIEGHDHAWKDCPNNPKSESFIRNNPCRIEGHEHDWIDCPDNPKSDNYVKPTSRKGKRGSKSSSSRANENKKHGSSDPTAEAEPSSHGKRSSNKKRGSVDPTTDAEASSHSKRSSNKKPGSIDSTTDVESSSPSKRSSNKKHGSIDPTTGTESPSHSKRSSNTGNAAKKRNRDNGSTKEAKNEENSSKQKERRRSKGINSSTEVSTETLDEDPKPTPAKPFVPAPPPAVSAWMSGPPPTVTQPLLPPSPMTIPETSHPLKSESNHQPKSKTGSLLDSVSNQLPLLMDHVKDAHESPSQVSHHTKQKKLSTSNPPTQTMAPKPILPPPGALFPGNNALFGESLESTSVYGSWNPPPMVMSTTHIDPWKPNPFAQTGVTSPPSGAPFGSIWSDSAVSPVASKKNSSDNGALRNGELLFIEPISSDVMEISASPIFPFASLTIDDNCSKSEK